ncbi:EAP30/Vps36 family-domain-containing protein [Pisolithus microcarpus]|nr:EAP30/Vps36 family-domain-containing protein [Pisolithus microcarpus]
MALRRYTTVVDGTIPIPALLYNDEELLASQDNVGIYDGQQKAMDHQSGTVHVTTHRLFFMNVRSAATQSFSMDLSHVIRTDHYTGLFKSSPKVTLFLDANSVSNSGNGDDADARFESWECEVCSYRNPPGLSPAAAQVCSLCGVPRNAVPAPTSQTSSGALPTPLASFPTSSTSLPGTPSRSGSPPPHGNGDPESIACSACTFLNHPSLPVCEMCFTPLPVVSQRFGNNNNTRTKSAPSSRPVSPVSAAAVDPANLLIKLSFRKGGEKALYNILKRALKARVWEGRQIGKVSRNGQSSMGAMSPEGSSTPTFLRTGIGGIIENVNASVKNTQTELSDAFQDLEALMVKARDLVQLAAELNEKLNASSTIANTPGSASPLPSFVAPSAASQPSTGSIFAITSLAPSAEPEEAKFIRSSLSQLGLQMTNAPVTPDMIRDERRWIGELARELAGILQGTSDDTPGQKPSGIMRQRGIVGLDEVWGGWNRARGVALIPPSTFLQTLQFLPDCTSPPIYSRTFKSGLRVLHTPPYTHASFTARLLGHLMLSEVLTTSQVAQEEKITISLTAEMIEAVEVDGVVCRDDERSAIRGGGSGSGSELRWTLNMFEEYVWDGQTFD